MSNNEQVTLLMEEHVFFHYLISEAMDFTKLKHLEHLEDFAIDSSPEGTHHVLDTLHDLHNYLQGRPSSIHVSTKYDGAPSIIAGKHPINGKFFVGTKSLFAKTPKINYTPEDVEKNHGGAPGLSRKLKDALELLPKVMPHKGIYQGDLMYSYEDKKEKGKNFEFTPNTITYKVEKGSPMGQLIKNSKMGVVFHTKYTGTDLNNMTASPIDNLDNFKQHSDVNVIDPKVHGKIKYDSKLQQQFTGAIKRIAQLNLDMSKSEQGKESHYAKMADQQGALKIYINQSIREGKDPSPEGYLVYLKQREIKAVDSVKTPWYKQQKKDHFDALMQRVVGDADAYGKMFKLHNEIQKAKKVAIKALNTSSPFEHSINGNKTGPEGFVMARHGVPSKLVDRQEFSKANFATNAKANAEDNPIVFAFGRMNPPTVGHGQLVSTVQDLARRKGATHLVVMSHSQDPKKNPLAPEQKLSYAKKMFPGTNMAVASDTEPSIFDQLKKLEKAGHKHVVIVAGSDRVEQYRKLIKDYNGQTFYIPKIEVASSGERDPDAEGVEGMSASKMRAAALSNDFETFAKGVTRHMDVKDAASMFKDLRKQMQGGGLIDARTPGITLARYAKRARNDALGNKARAEIERRKRLGLWQGSGGVT